MTSLVPVRASALRALALRALLVSSLAAGVLFAAPRQAHASDGYEVGFAAAGIMLPTLALDVTFIVATATGLTYEDQGWAIAQTIWAVASLGACGVGVVYAAQQPGFEGLAGGLAMIGGAQAVYLGYAIDALARGEWDDDAREDPGFAFGVAPMPDGAMASLGWRG
jgi:hypothetical protein